MGDRSAGNVAERAAEKCPSSSALPDVKNTRLSGSAPLQKPATLLSKQGTTVIITVYFNQQYCQWSQSSCTKCFMDSRHSVSNRTYSLFDCRLSEVGIRRCWPANLEQSASSSDLSRDSYHVQRETQKTFPV